MTGNSKTEILNISKTHRPEPQTYIIIFFYGWLLKPTVYLKLSLWDIGMYKSSVNHWYISVLISSY